MREGLIWINHFQHVDVVYLEFSKIFDTVSHSILLGILAAQGLDGSIPIWVKKGLDGQAQSATVNGVKSSCWPGTRVFCRDQYWGWSYLISLSLTWTKRWSCLQTVCRWNQVGQECWSAEGEKDSAEWSVHLRKNSDRVAWKVSGSQKISTHHSRFQC